MPRRRTKETKRNPLLDMPADQMWNTRGSVIWSNKVVVCPRCGKESRLTLAASLRSDWDLSLTCCPLPVMRRKPPPAKEAPLAAPQSNGTEPPTSTEPPPVEKAQSPDTCELEETEPPPKKQKRYRRRDKPHDTTDEGEAPAA